MLTLTPPRSTPPLNRAQLSPSSAPRVWLPIDSATRSQIEGRVAICAACKHVARATNCAACDLRCTHPGAEAAYPLIAGNSSVCPAQLWPVDP